MKLSYLFRTKKYGKWENGVVEVSEDIDKTDYIKIITLSLKSIYPESKRIEVQSVKRIN